jgi:hypothetical protein
MGTRETFSFPSSYVELIIIFFHFPPVHRALDEQSLDGPSRPIAGDLEVNNQLHLSQKAEMKMKDNKACQFISFFPLWPRAGNTDADDRQEWLSVGFGRLIRPKSN